MPSDQPSEVRGVPSYAALAARIFRPRRSRLLECVQRLTGAPEEVCHRSIVTGRGDPLLFFTQGWQTSLGPQSFARPSGAEAWEMLAPSEWMGEPRRGFGSSIADARETPPDLRTALALCADPRGVATAESLAREAIARLARRGCVVADRLIWRVLEPMIFRPRFPRSSGPGEICGRDLYDSMTGVSPTPGGLRLKYQRARRGVRLFCRRDAMTLFRRALWRAWWRPGRSQVAKSNLYRESHRDDSTMPQARRRPLRARSRVRRGEHRAHA